MGKKGINWHDLGTTVVGALMGTAMAAPEMMKMFQGQRGSGTMIGLGLGTVFLGYLTNKGKTAGSAE